MSDNLIPYPGAPQQPPDGVPPQEPETQAPPAPDPERLHALEVRLDIARERVLLWRIAVVLAALASLMLLRQIALG